MSRIDVVTGAGEGRSTLGAFDAALEAAGLADYNLVTLSSVVPPGTSVIRRDGPSSDFSVGTVVAVVLARAVSDDPGAHVAAGLGWALAEEGGVFMEATAPSRDECEAELGRRLEDVRANREWAWSGDDQVAVCTHMVESTGAAVVAAVYGSLDLDRPDRD